jgi:hypothetical protein
MFLVAPSPTAGAGAGAGAGAAAGFAASAASTGTGALNVSLGAVHASASKDTFARFRRFKHELQGAVAERERSRERSLGREGGGGGDVDDDYSGLPLIPPPSSVYGTPLRPLASDTSLAHVPAEHLSADSIVSAQDERLLQQQSKRLASALGGSGSGSGRLDQRFVVVRTPVACAPATYALPSVSAPAGRASVHALAARPAPAPAPAPVPAPTPAQAPSVEMTVGVSPSVSMIGRSRPGSAVNRPGIAALDKGWSAGGLSLGSLSASASASANAGAGASVRAGDSGTGRTPLGASGRAPLSVSSLGTTNTASATGDTGSDVGKAGVALPVSRPASGGVSRGVRWVPPHAGDGPVKPTLSLAAALSPLVAGAKAAAGSRGSDTTTPQHISQSLVALRAKIASQKKAGASSPATQ